MPGESHKDRFDVNKSWNRKVKRRLSIFDETDGINLDDDGKSSIHSDDSALLTDHPDKNTFGGVAKAKTHNKRFLPPILRLPKDLRIEIWKRTGYETFPSLRLTCSTIQVDIDVDFGVSVEIDEDEPHSVDFIEKVAIRHAVVTSLTSKVKDFLINPLLLVELSIHGPISTHYFRYFMEQCPNIQRLSIVFNRSMYKQATQFFPQVKTGCLQKLRAIRFSAHTKKESDLIYICDNIIALIAVELDQKSDLSSLNFSLGHKCPSEYLHELLLEIIILAHKNYSTLYEFHMVVTDNDPSRERSRKDLAFLPAVQETDSDSTSASRRGTGAVFDAKESEEEISHFTDDAKNIAVLANATRYLDAAQWKLLPKLAKVNICGNSHALGYLHRMLSQAPGVFSLQVEMNGGILKNSWVLYKSLFEKQYYSNITAIKLMGVHFEDKDRKPLDIDLRFFSNFKKLRKLSINCLQTEVMRLSKAAGIASLPKTLEEFEVSWILLSAWQLFRLLFCFKNMENLFINYSCISDSSFGWYLLILRLLIKWNLTNVKQVKLVDTKIKFRNKRALLKQLTDKVPVKVEYQDHEETLLVIDRGRAKTSEQSIPSIETSQLKCLHMDAEKWKKITASFSFASPDISELDNSKSVANQLNSDVAKPAPRRSLPRPRDEIPDKISTTCCELPQHVALQREVEQLKTLLHEKCQLIEIHQNTIYELRTALDASNSNKSIDNSKLLKHREIATQGITASQSSAKESAGAGDKPEGNVRHTNSLAGKSGNLSTQNFSTDVNWKQARNLSLKSTHTRTIDILPLVAERLDKLEKHMEELVKKLPFKVKHFCQEYISKCRLQYNEETGEMTIVQTPGNPRSPKIKPKVNAAFELRSRKNAIRIGQQQEVCTKDEAHQNAKQQTSDGKVTARLKHLESLVEDLKSSFIQLLVDGLKCKATLPNSKLPKLSKRLSKLQGLHCSASS